MLSTLQMTHLIPAATACSRHLYFLGEELEAWQCCLPQVCTVRSGRESWVTSYKQRPLITEGDSKLQGGVGPHPPRAEDWRL